VGAPSQPGKQHANAIAEPDQIGTESRRWNPVHTCTAVSHEIDWSLETRSWVQAKVWSDETCSSVSKSDTVTVDVWVQGTLTRLQGAPTPLWLAQVPWR
jgi:hypothetical protein